jgi:hypothetical protein
MPITHLPTPCGDTEPARIGPTARSHQNEGIREEWQAWIDECSGHFSKIVTALGFVIVAQRANFTNVCMATRALLQPFCIDRAFLAGYIHALEMVAAEFEVAPLTAMTADTVSLYYVVQMRLRRVRNIALGSDDYEKVGEIVLTALRTNLAAIHARLSE